MQLGQLLDQIRDYYVSRFIDILNECAADPETTVAHEPAYSDADGEVVTEGRLELPVRGDLLILRDGAVSEVLSVDTDGMLTFEPLEFQWDDNALHVDLHPFQWNGIPLRIFGLPPNPDWTPLREWFLHWFLEEDPPEDELLGGVHFMSDPEDDGECTQVSIDLGTAPVEVFEELLDALVKLGSNRVQIG